MEVLVSIKRNFYVVEQRSSSQDHRQEDALRAKSQHNQGNVFGSTRATESLTGTKELVNAKAAEYQMGCVGRTVS
jgi:hypothetical protein